MIKDPKTGVLKAFDFDNLLEKIPELKGVKDSTDHTDTSNAYM